jgi:hypothetical protein
LPNTMDGFGTSATFPGHVAATLWPVSATENCSERTIRERRGSPNSASTLRSTAKLQIHAGANSFHLGGWDRDGRGLTEVLLRHCLVGLWENNKNLCQNSLFPGRDSNPVTPDYKNQNVNAKPTTPCQNFASSHPLQIPCSNEKRVGLWM